MSSIAAALLASRRIGDNVLITGEHNSGRFARALLEVGVQVGVPSYPGCVVLETEDCGHTFYIWTSSANIELLAAVWGEELVERLLEAYAGAEIPVDDPPEGPTS